MSHRPPLTLWLTLILILGCTPSTPVRKTIQEAYTCVWLHPDSALTLLQSLTHTLPDSDDRALYRLTYSIAAQRLNSENPYNDLTDIIRHYRKEGSESYLFVARIQQAQLCGSRRRYTEALKHLQSATPLYAPSVPPRMRSLYHSIYGYLLTRSGDYTTALKHYDQSQAINLSEGFDDLTVSNAINLVNLPGAVPSDSLERFMAFYSPYVRTATADQQRKYYNNIGNSLKQNGDTAAAIRVYREVLDRDPDGKAIRTRLNYARLLDLTGHTEQAESLYRFVMLHADSAVLHRLYHHQTTRAMEKGDIPQAKRYMNSYLTAINHLYATRDRQELLEMQAKYNRTELELKSERNRNIVLKFLMLFVAFFTLGYIIHTVSRFYSYYKLGHYLGEYCRLMRAYRTSIHQCSHQEASYRKQLDELTGRISDLMKESNRFRTIYRVQTPYILVTAPDVSSMNLYLQLRQGKMRYEPARHRSTLYHWLNLTDDQFAERLAEALPTLSAHDLDLCCFYRLGFDNDHISGLYGQYSDSVRRHRLRLYPLLGVKDRNELEEFIRKF